MKFSTRSIVAACLALSAIGLIAFIGCTAGNPLIATDTANANAAAAKLATDQKAAATQPTTQNAAVIYADQINYTADLAQLKSDTAAIKQSQVAQGTQLAAMAVSAVPSPWSAPASAAIIVVGGLIGAYIGKGVLTSQQATNASTTIAASTNHTTAIVAALGHLAASVPVSALPKSIQPIAGEIQTVAETLIPTTTTTTTQTAAPAATGSTPGATV